MAIKLIQVPGVTNHQQIIWKIRVLQINDKNLVLGYLADWQQKSFGDYKKIMKVLAMIGQVDRIRDEKKVKKSDNPKHDGIYEIRADKGSARLMFFYCGKSNSAVICTNTYWKAKASKKEQDQAFETATNSNKFMSNKTEKRQAAKGATDTSLPDDLSSLFDNTRQASPEDLHELTKVAKTLQADPAFLADCSKGLIVEDILCAMEAQGLNRNTLAAKLGKSRQYIGKILDEERPANFTIDTLAEFSAALGIQLHVRMLPESEKMIFVRGVTVSTQVEPIADFPKSKTKIATLFDERFEGSNVIPFTNKHHDRTRLSS